MDRTTNPHFEGKSVGEETGYTLTNPQMIGILLFRHTCRIPENWNPKHYPYMVNLVYCAEATNYDERLMEIDGYEISSEFVSFTEAKVNVGGAINQEFINYAGSVSKK